MDENTTPPLLPAMRSFYQKKKARTMVSAHHVTLIIGIVHRLNNYKRYSNACDQHQLF